MTKRESNSDMEMKRSKRSKYPDEVEVPAGWTLASKKTKTSPEILSTCLKNLLPSSFFPIKTFLKTKKAMLKKIKERKERMEELESADADSEVDSSNFDDAYNQAGLMLAKAAMLLLITKKGDADYGKIKQMVRVSAGDEFITVDLKPQSDADQGLKRVRVRNINYKKENEDLSDVLNPVPSSINK